jgi:hypothetical protein
MRFDQWRAEAARIAAGMYGIEIDRVAKPYLWGLYTGGIPPWEAARLCLNAIAAQEERPDTTKRVKRA